MKLTLKIPDDKEIGLNAKALAQGLSPEQYVQQMLDRELTDSASTVVAGRPHISEVIREIWSDLPDESRAKLHADGSAQIKAYASALVKLSERSSPIQTSRSLQIAGGPSFRDLPLLRSASQRLQHDRLHFHANHPKPWPDRRAYQ